MIDNIQDETIALSETRTAVKDLVKGFQDYQSRMEAKLRVQDDRLAMIDRRAAGRPGLSGTTAEACPHHKAMAAYLRDGDESGLRGLDLKAMTTGSAADGGMPLDVQTMARINQVLEDASSLRRIASVVQVEGASFETLAETGSIDTAWLSETAEPVESIGEAFHRISIPLHELSAMPRASQRLLDDGAFDVEAWLAGSIADRFARAENVAFVSGTGTDMPRGFLTYDKADYTTAAWGQIGIMNSGVDGGFDSEDPTNTLIDLVYSLDVKYRRRAAFVMNSQTVNIVRKMKNVEGDMLWTNSLCKGEPSTLLGHPVIINEAMPGIGIGNTPIAFGDFHAGYTIVERPGIRVLRDPYTVKPHVQFYASSRIGGDVTDFNAIRLLQLSA
jgi:HK97 family phage major capsid protein